MTVLYDQTLVLTQQHTQAGSAGAFNPSATFEVAGIPWGTFGTGPLHVEITADIKRSSGLTMQGLINAYLSAPGSGTAFSYAGEPLVYQDVNNPTTSFGTDGPYASDITGPGVASSIYFVAWVTFPGFVGGSYDVKNVRVVVSTLIDPAAATIENPPAGAIQPTADIVFTATSGSDLTGPTTATVTTSDGATVVAWSLGAGFADGFDGIIASITNGIRVTLRRLGQWPMGAMSLALLVSDTAPSTATASRSWTVGVMLPATGVQDYVAQALSRVIIQYRDRPKLNAEIKMHASIVQEIANVLAQITLLDDPAIATGVNLDVTGEFVGQGRDIGNGDVATDGELRVLIGARITRNNTRVSAPEYLAALVQFFGAKVVLNDPGGMSLSYVVMRTPTTDETALLDRDIVARPMGVKVSRSFSAGTGYFGWSDDPDALGFSEISDGGTTGGFWTELF